MEPMSQTNFGAAARRNFEDAELLYTNRRYTSADHLYGIAAECALKEVLLLGGYATLDNSYVSINNRQVKDHAGGARNIWTTTSIFLHGRVEIELLALLNENPLQDWNIDKRYSDGTEIMQPDVLDHRRACVLTLRALQSIHISYLMNEVQS